MKYRASPESPEVDLHLHDQDPEPGHDYLLLVLFGVVFGFWIGNLYQHADIREHLNALEKRIPVPAEATKP